MPTIRFNALDTLFFRDGKPFNMGEDNQATGLFPPYPSVIYGALRSTYLSESLDELELANEENDPTRFLNIIGYYLYFKDNILFPLPEDCRTKNDPEEQIALLMNLYENDFSSNYDLPYILSLPEEETSKAQDNLISKIELINYFQEGSKISEYYYEKKSNCLLIEPKIGISIDSQKGISEDGKLYSINFNRPASELKNGKYSELDIIVEYEGLNLPEKGLLRIGAEGKAVRYEHIQEKFNNNISFPKKGQCKWYLATPTIYKKGWYPDWLDKERGYSGQYKGVKFKLLAAAIGTSCYIGGFDIKEKRPKKMYKAVPAGSVYYFEYEGDLNNVIESLNKENISEIRAEEGFGISYLGVI
ncbi:MAG: type III-B CRISPR module-associated protein Cmr3 [Candidatus Woesearchaeota archaeon]